MRTVQDLTEEPYSCSFISPTQTPVDPSLMETAVRKATRLEYQPPKRKHLDSTFPSLSFFPLVIRTPPTSR